MAVDRRLLLDALSPIYGDKHKTHIWGQEIDVQHLKLEAIVISDLGTYEVPMRSEKLASIVNEQEKPVHFIYLRNEQSSCAASPEKIIAPRQTVLREKLKPFVDQTLREKFGPGLENARMSVIIQPTGLIICQHSNSCVKLLSKGTHSAFATMFMQLPVDQETTVSANMDILISGRKTNFIYQQKSPFYLTFVAGYQNSVAEVTVQSTSASNPVVFLQFDLFWSGCYGQLFSNNGLHANVFLEFLEKLVETNQALVGWENISVYQLQEETSTKGPQSLEAQENALLCIPTRHNYHVNEFRAENLKDEDALAFHLLMTIHYLDVSIVILKIAHDEANFNETSCQLDHRRADSTEEKTFTIHRWIEGYWTFPYYPCLRCDRYLLGDVTSVVEEANFDDVLNERKLAKRSKLEEDPSRNFTYHPAILIRPRNAAIFGYWKYCPIQATVSLKIRVKSFFWLLNYTNEGHQRLLIEEVNAFLGLLAKDDGKLTECQRTAVLHELLFVCTQLKSIAEGLKVMELIPQMWCSCRKAHTNLYDGCETMMVEERVMYFVSLAGWQKCCNLVYGMYSRYEDADYDPLCNLSWALSEIDCADGAIYMAKACMKILAERDTRRELHEFEWVHLEFFVGLILPETSSNERKEFYALLKKLVLNYPDALQFLILGYFGRVRNGEENLDEFKLTIAELISESDRFADDPTVFFVIRFAYRTEDAELAERIWVKLLTITDEQNEEGQFEEMLLDAISWNDMNQCEDLYRAIALSPLVTERFYKFIEKRKTVSYGMNACCYHLTMAQNVPSLADEQKLQSFIASFKEMNVKRLSAIANSIVDFNHCCLPDGAPRISQTIVTALLESLPTNDLASLLTQETDDFCNILYCYETLGSDDLKLDLAKTLKETCISGHSFHLDTRTERVLLESWLTCLNVELDDRKSHRCPAAAYHVLSFFRVYLNCKRIYWLQEKEVWDSIRLSLHQVTWEFLEKTLVALYEREHKRAPEQCLKAIAAGLDYWEISQALSDLLASDQELAMAILNFEPERIVKLMCCILWLGSQAATSEFAILLTSLPSCKTKYCLSLFVLSNDELQTCAISSSYAFSALQSLIRHCIKELFGDVVGVSSWARHDQVDDLDIEEFYQSEDESRSFDFFETLDEAQEYADSATKGLPWADYIIRNHDGSYSCTITKLYPVLVDAAFKSEIPAISKNLRKSCNDFLPEGSPVDDVSKMPLCSVCLAPSLASR